MKTQGLVILIEPDSDKLLKNKTKQNKKTGKHSKTMITALNQLNEVKNSMIGDKKKRTEGLFYHFTVVLGQGKISLI